MEKDKFFTNGTRSPLPPNWQSSSLGMDSRLVDVNCFPEQMQSCFPSLSWENSVNQNVQFESALSSIASSSALAVSNAGNPDDNVVIRELIGRLGGICNAGEISPHHQTLSGAATSYSTNASCHSTPMNSPPKLNLSAGLGNSVMAHPSLAPFSADPGFAERAAKYSFFGSGNFGAMTSQLGLPPTELPYRSLTRVESGKLSRVSSSQSLKVGSQLGPMDGKETALSDGLDAEMRSVSASPSASDRKFGRLSRSSTPDDTEFGNTHEESSPSEWTAVGESGLNGFPNDNNARKRKGVPRGRAKELPSSPLAKDPKTVEEDDSNAKRSKSTEADANGKDGVKTKTEPNATQNVADDTHKQNKINEKPPEPPKQDYIHVRARRGQATDSHSLAERVRREKISERMKLLQDLVPGCNKVTGKAVMLDEIINYVQSLQRQVEFLSMKLANVNPRMDFNMDALLSKDAQQSRGPLANSMYSFDSSASAILYGQRSQHGTMPSLASSGSEVLTCANPLGPRQNLGIQLPTVAGYNASSESFWEDDLQSVVQMGFGQNQETAFPSYSFPGSTPTSHMKIEP